ncbi:MAG TPA: sigma 54-interacting transcriptional regulator [Thermodesulfobacteriota bacterium]|nr:sigma 54-interacting transcriptional regulator [Thermodesulfobacteriota bacterium]
MNDIFQIFFGNSSKMNRIKATIEEVAKTDITVLIKGESGTGKELLAQAIHLDSDRKDKPFIKVNCATIPKGLLESELFGFEKGAFTGAHLEKPGKFELANHGTILLNDIGEIDISIQAKLLQVLQDGMFSRLGGNGDVMVNTRVIATTKDHLEKTMMEGRFRGDLFFRVNVISITVPPLRDRKEQILPLSQYYFDFYKKKYGRETLPFSSLMLNAFKEYAWPGNIRELENMVKRIVLFGEESTVLQAISGKRSDGGSSFPSNENSFSSPSAENKSLNLKEVGKKAAEVAEKEIIQNTLQETHWNRKRAAKLLRVSYKALLYKIQKYHLDDIAGNRKVGEEML